MVGIPLAVSWKHFVEARRRAGRGLIAELYSFVSDYGDEQAREAMYEASYTAI
jgi:hypothetical protein